MQFLFQAYFCSRGSPTCKNLSQNREIYCWKPPTVGHLLFIHGLLTAKLLPSAATFTFQSLNSLFQLFLQRKQTFHLSQEGPSESCLDGWLGVITSLLDWEARPLIAQSVSFRKQQPRWKRGSIVNVNCRAPDASSAGDDLPDIERNGGEREKLPDCLFPGRQFSGFSCFAFARSPTTSLNIGWFACFKSTTAPARRPPQPNWFVFAVCFCRALPKKFQHLHSLGTLLLSFDAAWRVKFDFWGNFNSSWDSC